MSSPARPSATMVGDKFTKLYYSLMKDKPDQLHEVYKDSSMIGRPGKEGKMCHYTLSDIGENLNMLTSGGYDSVVVSNVVSQESINGSVAVNVDGYFVLNEKRLQRKFVQAFFLAPQEDGYFVMNDMFIFQDEKIPEVAGFTTILSKRPDCLKIRDTDADDTSSKESQECSAIHLKNLPSNYTIESIENACKEFGTIKRGRTEVRMCYYGIVEFEEAEAAQRAIEASTVTICGEKVCVEKRRSTDKRYGEHKRIHEEKRRQDDQNIHQRDQVRGAVELDRDQGRGGTVKEHNWLKTLKEGTSIVQKKERGTVVVDEAWYVNWLKTTEERSIKHQEEERRLGDFWEWQRSMALQSKFREETGDTGVDHSWDNDVIMEEHRKFMEEEQRKIQEEEHQN